jgi:elongation factor G
VLALAVQAKEHKDDVKLGQAFTKLTDEDPSLAVVHDAANHEIVIWGQGEMHLRVATERLSDRFGVPVLTRPPTVGYRESIRKPVTVRGRHKKQSGGHGQFGDVVVEIKPLPRSTGFKFEDKITGGVVPRNYIPAVEEGIRDALKHGPLGFPVVDLEVALIDGSYHTVDSSDMAFRTAGRIAIHDGLPDCQPVLLEPIHLVEIVCPNDATARMNAILSGRREIGDLIIEVRSATAGVGSFTYKFDHMAELVGRTAEQIVAAKRAAE